MVLVQLGEWSGDSVQVACALPGTKLREGEIASEALQRLLRGIFAPIADAIELRGAELEETWKESKRKRLTTKYVRTVNRAELVEEEPSALVETQVIDPSGSNFEMVIFALADEAGKIILITWLTPSDLRHYTSLEGELQLQAHMEGIHLQAGLVERAQAQACVSERLPGVWSF